MWICGVEFVDESRGRCGIWRNFGDVGQDGLVCVVTRDGRRPGSRRAFRILKHGEKALRPETRPGNLLTAHKVTKVGTSAAHCPSHPSHQPHLTHTHLTIPISPIPISPIPISPIPISPIPISPIPISPIPPSHPYPSHLNLVRNLMSLGPLPTSRNRPCPRLVELFFPQPHLAHPCCLVLWQFDRREMFRTSRLVINVVCRWDTSLFTCLSSRSGGGPTRDLFTGCGGECHEKPARQAYYV